MKFRRNLNALKFFRRCFNWSARQCETAVGRHGEIVTVRPTGTPKGSVVLSYHTDPWLFPDGRETHYHTNRWECGLIGDTFVEAGYRLDVVEHNNPHYVPLEDTAFAIDLEQNLERYSRLAPGDCVKIHHASTTHWTHWNLAELTRLHAIQQRRGVTLVPRRQIPPNLAHEVCDRAIMVGNAFTGQTYAFSGKPMHRIPISTTTLCDWPAEKNLDKLRRNFIWFGSVGLAHKGLDLVLEAFVRMPELKLTVVGGIHLDPDFKAAYRRELYETPNIHTPGWISATSPEFLDLLRNQVGVVYPSCAEGGAGSVIVCMHCGLIPIVTRSASIDIGDFGFETRSEGIMDIIDATREVAALPTGQLNQRSRAAWEHARRVHTRENFRRVWRDYARETLRLDLKQD
ncbi:MAG TPA: glycosyltransferase [Opitutaceae bacterium]|nr:glycosyltransferase [Opitutaceae bacterium]